VIFGKKFEGWLFFFLKFHEKLKKTSGESSLGFLGISDKKTSKISRAETAPVSDPCLENQRKSIEINMFEH
jgi:hypothetical protein